MKMAPGRSQEREQEHFHCKIPPPSSKCCTKGGDCYSYASTGYFACACAIPVFSKYAGLSYRQRNQNIHKISRMVSSILPFTCDIVRLATDLQEQPRYYDECNVSNFSQVCTYPELRFVPWAIIGYQKFDDLVSRAFWKLDFTAFGGM